MLKDGLELKLITKISLFIFLVFLFSSIFANPITASIYGNINAAHLDGFIQTPKGGSAGTTSMGRPTFDEVHTHYNTFYSLGADIDYRDYFGLFNYYHFEPHGSATLAQALITHNQFIPQGSFFDMFLKFDWYSLGFGKKFHPSSRTTFSPSLLISWVKYHYEFSAPPIESARNFSLVGANFGLKLEHYLTPTLLANIDALIPLPLSNIKIVNLNTGLAFVLPTTLKVKVIPRIAVGWLQLEYKDEQPIPNYIRYRASPYGSFELKLLFP